MPYFIETSTSSRSESGIGDVRRPATRACDRAIAVEQRAAVATCCVKELATRLVGELKAIDRRRDVLRDEGREVRIARAQVFGAEGDRERGRGRATDVRRAERVEVQQLAEMASRCRERTARVGQCLVRRPSLGRGEGRHDDRADGGGSGGADRVIDHGEPFVVAAAEPPEVERMALVAERSRVWRLTIGGEGVSVAGERRVDQQCQ
jgi:hypothetical protein